MSHLLSSPRTQTSSALQGAEMPSKGSSRRNRVKGEGGRGGLGMSLVSGGGGRRGGGRLQAPCSCGWAGPLGGSSGPTENRDFHT